jgi:hypothetical protein
MGLKCWTGILCAALAVLVGFNVLVAELARSQGEELIRGLPANGDFDQLFLGNSTMVRGFDAKAYAAAAGLAEAKVLKLALGGVSAEEECLLLEEFFARGNRLKQLVLGFHDLHLEGNAQHTWSSLSGATNLIYFVPHERAQQVYHLPFIESQKVLLTRWVPMLVRRSNLWANVEQLRRNMEEIGLPEVHFTADGRVQDLKFYPYLERERNAVHEIMRRLANSQVPLSKVLERIISICKAHHTGVVVLEMPLSAERVALCENDQRWQDYRAARALKLIEFGVRTVRFLKWSDEAADFADPVHMRPDSAVRFSQQLAAMKLAVQ